jgi:hypothetical protein
MRATMLQRRSTSPLSATLSPALAVVLLAALSGCGGSSGGGHAPDGGGPSGTGTFTWKDGGTIHTALFASGARVTSAGLDMVQVTGSDAGAAVSFGVSLRPPPLLPGAYACSDNGAATGRIVSIDYTIGTVSGLAPTCAITLTSFGDSTGTHATGTFSATVPLSDGTTRMITDGAYDVPLTVSSL